MKTPKIRPVQSEDALLQQLKSTEESVAAVDAPTTPEVTESPEEAAIFDAAIQHETQMQEQYGKSPTTAAALGAARVGTFGISDQLLTTPLKVLGNKPLVTPEALREYTDRNKAATYTGQALGLIAPTLATGGASLAAKGVGVLGAGVKAMNVAGSLTEKGLVRLLQSTGNPLLTAKIIQKTIPSVAGSAVSGSLYSAGELISEDALGTKEFNAENLLAAVGSGAIFAGVAGGAFGTLEAVIPMIRKGGEEIVGKLGGKFKSSLDPVENALDLVGVSEKAKRIMMKNNPQQAAALPEFLAEEVKMGRLTTTTDLKNGFTAVKDDARDKVSSVLNRVEEIAKNDPDILVTQESVYNRVLGKINEFLEGKKSMLEMGKVLALKKETEQLIASSENKLFNPLELDAYRREIDSKINWKVLATDQTEFNKVAKGVRRVLREETDNIADRASARAVSDADKTLYADLKSNLKRESMALEMLPYVEKKLDKAKLINFSDLVLGGAAAGISATSGDSSPLGMGVGIVAGKKFLQSDFLRKHIILSQIEKTNQTVTKGIEKAVSGAIFDPASAAKTSSINVMLSTAYARPNFDGKKPENKNAALNNVRENLTRIKTDPDFLQEKLYKSTLRLSKHTPEISQIIQQRIVATADFLDSKVPKNNNINGALDFKRPSWQPSSVELAKFERYLEAAEHPLNVLGDIKSGSVSPEQVETLKTLYPDLYSRIQTEVMNQIGKAEGIPYSKRLQLGLLLDIPADASLNPEYIKKLQSTFAEQKPSEPKMTATGLQKLKGPEVASDVEKIQTRK